MDEEEFPANRRNPKPREPKETKVVEKVTTGVVARRKKPFTKRLAEVFVADDAQSVGSYILFDVLIPAAKDVIADVVSQSIERTLFGGARSASRRTGLRPGGSSGGHVSYNRYASTPPWNRDRREERPQVSRRARASHDFDEIILATRHEAEEVIDRLFDLVARYEQATVADLYELVGITGQFTDEKWGWTDIRGSGVTRINSGYLLDLPKPEPLD
jgi:hypothetical protein